MTLEIEVNGDVRTITIEPVGDAGPAGGRFRVGMAPRAHIDVDVCLADLGLSMLFPADGRQVDAAVTDRAGGEYFVQLPHASFTAIVDGRRARRGATGASAGSGEQRVTAPMPGRVVRVLVKPGDDIATRQGLIVVEAMKMENELTASRAGRVKEVAVAQGQSVQAGQLLVIVE